MRSHTNYNIKLLGRAPLTFPAPGVQRRTGLYEVLTPMCLRQEPSAKFWGKCQRAFRQDFLRDVIVGNSHSWPGPRLFCVERRIMMPGAVFTV